MSESSNSTNQNIRSSANSVSTGQKYVLFVKSTVYKKVKTYVACQKKWKPYQNPFFLFGPLDDGIGVFNKLPGFVWLTKESYIYKVVNSLKKVQQPNQLNVSKNSWDSLLK